ncbi:MAG: nitroreductase [Candidatus Cloacimonadota bacterium]|nr:MAG: nitroreductase [Candidatus Cloacimonadota bacterium]PIE78406.1 MAG: nitroreductase [Candidatus Delongbacteria bacterium]
MKREIIFNREFLKSNFMELSGIETDQERGKEAPTLQKSWEGYEKIVLPDHNIEVSNNKFDFLVSERKSRRKFLDKPILLKELSYLLWSTQGVKLTKSVKSGSVSFRTVPSGGARHPLETYLMVKNVEGLNEGLYLYLPFEHSLIFIKSFENFDERLVEALKGQKWSSFSAVTFFWVAICYRAEWKYDIASHKMILLDAGHVCQNLYLASESINCGTCAIAAYNQKKSDQLLGVDGNNEMVVYISPVGKVL